MPTLSKTWAQTELCHGGDVLAEYPDVALVITGPDGNKITAAARAAAKREIGERLTEHLPRIFGKSTGQLGIAFDEWMGLVSADTLDNVLDYLVNAESCLKSAAVAWTVKTLWEMRRSGLNAQYGSNVETETLIIKEWSDKFEERFTRGVNALKLDIDRDGVVGNWERVRYNNLDFGRA